MYTAARIDAGLTYDQLVDRLADRGVHVSRTTAHAWANERAPRSAWLRDIAAALGVAQRRLVR